MKNIFTKYKFILPLVFVSAGLMSVLSVPAFTTQQAFAVNVVKDENRGFFAFANDQNIENTNVIQNIVNILLFVLGTTAVIAIIIGGISYTTANGDASKTKQAKDTIMYAVIGLIVALMAWAIVSFVLQQF